MARILTSSAKPTKPRAPRKSKVVAPVSLDEPAGPPEGDVSDAGAVSEPVDEKPVEHFVRPDLAGIANVGGVTEPDLGGALASQIVSVTAPDGTVLHMSKVNTSTAERDELTARFLAEHA